MLAVLECFRTQLSNFRIRSSGLNSDWLSALADPERPTITVSGMRLLWVGSSRSSTCGLSRFCGVDADSVCCSVLRPPPQRDGLALAPSITLH